jgi:hypothetical protein
MACGSRTRPGRLNRQVWLLAVLALLLSGCAGQEQWGPFRGRIVDADTGAPIAGAHVIVTWYERQPNPVQRQLVFFDAQETVTDEDGYFELPGLDRTFNLTMEPPAFDYFVPGYVAERREVTPPDGQPFVDPTVITMRALETWQCYEVGRPSVMIPQEKIPNLTRDLQAAVDECLARERRSR